MKKLLHGMLAALFITGAANAQNYASQNVSLLGHWYNPTEHAEPVYGIKYQGVWGWYQQSTGHEYAILGADAGTYFIDVTNPANPIQCDYVPGRRNNCIWHEIKSYQNYCYIASDDAAPNSFIIADMSYLPDSVHIVYDDTTLFERCHTIYVDGDKLYGGSVTRRNNVYYSMAVYDLSSTPDHPQLIHTLNQDYATPGTVHDMFVRNDTVFASGGYDGLYILKFNDGTTNTFTQMATLTNYQDHGYNHSSFLTSDAHTLIFMDEVPAGLGIKSLDVSNFGNLTMNQVFRSNTGDTPHNPYILGNKTLVAANYSDGIQIFDISNPTNCVRTGYFDTDTLSNPPSYLQDYHGCWGAYTDLPSGHLLAADMQNGLYVLDISQAAGIPTVSQFGNSASAYPNPFNNNFYVKLSLAQPEPVYCTVYDNAGRLVKEAQQNLPAGNNLFDIEAAGLQAGIYMVHVSTPSFGTTVKLVKTN